MKALFDSLVPETLADLSFFKTYTASGDDEKGMIPYKHTRDWPIDIRPIEKLLFKENGVPVYEIDIADDYTSKTIETIYVIVGL